jgi:voltage-gated potassium channel
MRSSKHITISLLVAVTIILLGTVGYMYTEGWGVLDSLYMTVITLATVGFGEVHPLSQAGRLFTVLLIIVGVASLGYFGGALFQFMVEGKIQEVFWRRRLDHKIKHMRNHFIVCGYGRIGRVLCQCMKNSRIPVLVVEENPDLVPALEVDNMNYLCADATDETSLIKAGIQDAKGLVAALNTDAANVFLVLTARQLNKDLYIVSRATQEQAQNKLLAAGADRVESPYEMGAIGMAQRIIRPTVTSFLDLAYITPAGDIQMEEIPVSADSGLAGVMLKDSGIRQKFNVIIIAIKSAGGNMSFNPSFESTLNGGDTVIAIGSMENLSKLERVLAV